MSKRGMIVIFWKVLFHQLPLILLLAIPVVAIYSWVCSLYIDESVRSLLNADGIRWSVSSIMTNLDDAPLTYIGSFLICSGVLLESGFISTIITFLRERKWHESSVSLKQRRAFMLTLGMVEAIAAFAVILCLFQSSLLLSAFGTIESSPLSRGWFGLLVMLLILIGNVFGYTSGKFVNTVDFINAHTLLLRKCAGYFIVLFISSELIACVKYTGLLSDDATIVLSYALYYVPLVCYYFSSILSSRTYQIKPFTSL